MYDKKSLDKLSGNDSTARIKYTPSLIKFNGSRGIFTLIEKTDAGYGQPQPITAPLNVTILRPRRVCGWYEKDPKGVAVSYFTNEHNAYNDVLTLFSAEKDGKAQVIDTGTSGELYEKYPLLRTSVVLYVLYNGVVHKLKLKGKSLKAFKDYREALAKDDKAFYEFETELSIKKEESQSFDYYSVLFNAVVPTDLEKVGPFIEQVGSILDKIDEQHAKAAVRSQDANMNMDGPIIEVPEDEEPETLNTANSDIKVDDIPF